VTRDDLPPDAGGWRPVTSPVAVPAAAPATSPIRAGGATRATTQEKDGRSWRLGTAADVAWIAQGVADGSAMPAGFAAYATVMVPGLREDLDRHEQAVVRLLADHSAAADPNAEAGWWLGYLDTGASDVVFQDAPRVKLYWDWPYVLVEAGPDQALQWRTEPSPLHCGLPDLIFPADRSWLISALWDDEWWWLGGSQALVDAFAADPALEVRRLGARP
jgi:hypothetical protein